MPSLIPHVIPPGSWGEQPQPSIKGEELLLRPWQAGDEPFLVQAYADAAIQRWHSFTLRDESEATAWRERTARRWREETGADWAVTEEGKQLGRIGFRIFNLTEGEGEVAYWVAPAARNQQVASRAVNALVEWAATVGMHRLTLMHSVGNEASCKVAQHCGFPLEGIATRALLHQDGWHDTHLHARLLE